VVESIGSFATKGGLKRIKERHNAFYPTENKWRRDVLYIRRSIYDSAKGGLLLWLGGAVI